MKRLFLIGAVLATAAFFSSCDKDDVTPTDTEAEIWDFRVYKIKSSDYADKVWIWKGSNSGKVYFPERATFSDTLMYMDNGYYLYASSVTELGDGTVLYQGGGMQGKLPISVTRNEWTENYEKEYTYDSNETWKALCEKLYSEVIDEEPIEETYRFSYADSSLVNISYYDDGSIQYGNPKFDVIKESISSGEFFTHEGVTRIK